MQYNNQAQEAFKVTVQDDGTVKMDWLKRFSNTAQHCRPQVVVADGATEGFITSVEANNQPAEIGFRVTKFNVATGSRRREQDRGALGAEEEQVRRRAGDRPRRRQARDRLLAQRVGQSRSSNGDERPRGRRAGRGRSPSSARPTSR